MQKAYQFYLEKLQTIYNLEEAKAIANNVFEEVMLVKPHQIKILNIDNKYIFKCWITKEKNIRRYIVVYF